MRRDQSETLTEAAHRRLELIARELQEAGLARVADASPDDDDVEEADPAEPAAPLPAIVRPAGRHLRRQGPATAPGDRLGGWVDDRLPLPLRGRLQLGARELVLVALLAAVGLMVAAVTVLHGSAAEVTAPSATPADPLLTPDAALATSPSATAGAGPSADSSATGFVVVDVTGKVRRPGVVRLPAGARVVDALRRAGGARPHADLTSINLAALLTDGQQIVVGAPAAPPPTGTGSAGAGATGGPLLDLNDASEQELEGLPGVGPVTAQKILDWRTAHGAFSSLDELLEVDGIGPKTLADLAPHLTL